MEFIDFKNILKARGKTIYHKSLIRSISLSIEQDVEVNDYKRIYYKLSDGRTLIYDRTYLYGQVKMESVDNGTAFHFDATYRSSSEFDVCVICINPNDATKNIRFHLIDDSIKQLSEENQALIINYVEGIFDQIAKIDHDKVSTETHDNLTDKAKLKYAEVALQEEPSTLAK